MAKKIPKTKITRLFNMGVSLRDIAFQVDVPLSAVKRYVSKKLSDKMDEMWATAVKKRDGECLICGARHDLNAHHLIERGNKRFRWSLKNGITLCQNHHVFSRDISAHAPNTAAALRFSEWLQSEYPELYNNTLENSNKKQEGKLDIFECYDRLKGEIDELEAR